MCLVCARGLRLIKLQMQQQQQQQNKWKEFIVF